MTLIVDLGTKLRQIMSLPEENGKAKLPPDVELNTVSSNVEPGDSEEMSLVEQQQRRVSLGTAIKLRTTTLIVSWMSAVVLLILGVITFIGAVLDESSAAFAFAFNAFLDCMSSFVVIWRFSGNGGLLYSVKKECMACLVLGVLFLISGVIVAGQSIYSLTHSIIPTESSWLYWGSLVDVIACLGLVTIKIYLAYKLESKTLLTDAFNTFIGVILASSTLIGYSVYEGNHQVWQIDSVTGLICCIGFFFYGSWIIYVAAKTMKELKKG